MWRHLMSQTLDLFTIGFKAKSVVRSVFFKFLGVRARPNAIITISFQNWFWRRNALFCLLIELKKIKISPYDVFHSVSARSRIAVIFFLGTDTVTKRIARLEPRCVFHNFILGLTFFGSLGYNFSRLVIHKIFCVGVLAGTRRPFWNRRRVFP